MATNRELIEQARALAEQLGAPVETQGLNNAKLTALVESLHQRLSAQEVHMPAVRAAQEAPEVQANTAKTSDIESFTNPDAGYAPPSEKAEPIYVDPVTLSPIEEHVNDPSNEDLLRGGKVSAVASVGKYQFTVAKGKSLVCRRGILPEFTQIKLSDLGGDEDARSENMHHLIDIGCVLYNPTGEK
jgi:hypothetical protein